MSKINLLTLIGILISTNLAFSSELSSTNYDLPLIKKLTVQVDITFNPHQLWRVIDNGKLVKPMDENKYKTWHTICLIRPKELSEITKTWRTGKSYPGELLTAYKSSEGYFINFPDSSQIKVIECINLVGRVTAGSIPSEPYIAPTVEEAQQALKGVINLELNDNGDID